MAKTVQTTKKDEPKKPIIDHNQRPKRLNREFYEEEIARLQYELVKLQYWVKDQGLRIVLLFEGRDAAGHVAALGRYLIEQQVGGHRVGRVPAQDRISSRRLYLQ